jgi:hypothetical protein
MTINPPKGALYQFIRAWLTLYALKRYKSGFETGVNFGSFFVGGDKRLGFGTFLFGCQANSVIK